MFQIENVFAIKMAWMSQIPHFEAVSSCSLVISMNRHHSRAEWIANNLFACTCPYFFINAVITNKQTNKRPIFIHLCLIIYHKFHGANELVILQMNRVSGPNEKSNWVFQRNCMRIFVNIGKLVLRPTCVTCAWKTSF